VQNVIVELVSKFVQQHPFDTFSNKDGSKSSCLSFVLGYNVGRVSISAV
jgi:hypothetical protein